MKTYSNIKSPSEDILNASYMNMLYASAHTVAILTKDFTDIELISFSEANRESTEFRTEHNIQLDDFEAEFQKGQQQQLAKVS